MNEKKITFDSFIRGLLSAFLIIGIFYMINKLSSVLLPFFIAWLIAYLMYPLVHFFEKTLRFRSRVLSILISMVLVIAILVGAFYLLIPPMIGEASRLNGLINSYIQGNYHTTLPALISDFINKNVDFKALSKLITGDSLMSAVQTIVPQLWSILYGSISLLFSIVASFIILLYVFFILKDYEALANGWIELVPQKHQKFVNNLVKDVQNGMNSYFRGQALIAFLVGVLFCIGFTIIDFPLAIGLGLFIGLLNMVPYLQLIGFIPTILLALLKAADTGENFWWITFCALLVFVIVQLIQDTILTPKIMGKITGLNPALILLSLSIWGYLLGIIGMIIAIPLTTLLIAYYKQYMADFNEKQRSNATSAVKNESASTEN